MTQLELRKMQYEKIVDEVLFIARASEGSVSEQWIMDQPIFIRKKYLDIFQKEIEQRNKELNKNSKTKSTSKR